MTTASTPATDPVGTVRRSEHGRIVVAVADTDKDDPADRDQFPHGSRWVALDRRDYRLFNDDVETWPVIGTVPGTPAARRTIRVQWAESAIRDAYDRVHAAVMADGDQDVVVLNGKRITVDAFMPLLDATRAVLDPDQTTLSIPLAEHTAEVERLLRELAREETDSALVTDRLVELVTEVGGPVPEDRGDALAMLQHYLQCGLWLTAEARHENIGLRRRLVEHDTDRHEIEYLLDLVLGRGADAGTGEGLVADVRAVVHRLLDAQRVITEQAVARLVQVDPPPADLAARTQHAISAAHPRGPWWSHLTRLLTRRTR